MLLRFLEQPPAVVEIIGYLLVAMVAVEIAVGKRRFGVGKWGFLRLHAALAWALAVFLGLHAVIGIGHSVLGFILKR